MRIVTGDSTPRPEYEAGTLVSVEFVRVGKVHVPVRHFATGEPWAYHPKPHAHGGMAEGAVDDGWWQLPTTAVPTLPVRSTAADEARRAAVREIRASARG